MRSCHPHQAGCEPWPYSAEVYYTAGPKHVATAATSMIPLVSSSVGTWRCMVVFCGIVSASCGAGCWLMLMHQCLPCCVMSCGGFRTRRPTDRELCLHWRACLAAIYLVVVDSLHIGPLKWNPAGTNSLHAWCLVSS